MEIAVDLLTRPQEAVLERSFRRHFSTETKAYLQPLGRVGKSGARLFLVYFGGKAQGVPYVAKLHSAERIKKEADAHAAVKTAFPDCSDSLLTDFHSGLGVIIYRHVGASHAGTLQNSFPLADVLYDRIATPDDGTLAKQLLSAPPSEIAKKLDQLFSGACHHQVSNKLRTTLYREYEWYLRNHRAAYMADERIADMLGKGARKQAVEVIGTQVLNPLIVIKKSFRQKMNLQSCAVHGDLHPNNIILDASGVPHVIDFEWATRNGHFLKDFVLLENSVRFLSFPAYANEQLRLRVDEVLLDEEGYNNVARIAPRGGRSASAFLRLGEMVRIIRSHARRAAGGSLDFNEYLAAQFLVLYGLMRFDEYASPAVLRALGLIATKLKDSRHISI